MRKNGFSGRTVTIKVRLHDFTTLSRSSTLPSPTDDGGTIARVARALLGDLDTTGGVRLLGVGVSGLADWVQEDLFGESPEDDEVEEVALPPQHRSRTWPPGADVVHDEMGRGWVWGSGSGVVTVRFETADTPPGPVRNLPRRRPRAAPRRAADRGLRPGASICPWGEPPEKSLRVRGSRNSAGVWRVKSGEGTEQSDRESRNGHGRWIRCATRGGRTRSRRTT